jgi:hypothetical protein
MIRQTNAFLNGLLIFGLIGAYFILLESLGLTDNLYLRFVNFLLVLIGVNNTLKSAAAESKSYPQRLISGVITVFTGIFLSALSLFIYLSLFDANLSAMAMTLIPAETNLSFAMVIFIEGFTSSLMVVFIMLQYWKNVEVSPSKA